MVRFRRSEQTVLCKPLRLVFVVPSVPDNDHWLHARFKHLPKDSVLACIALVVQEALSQLLSIRLPLRCEVDSTQKSWTMYFESCHDTSPPLLTWH